MKFETKQINDILVVTPPVSDLDASNAEEFKRDVAPLVDGHSRVVMDLGRVGFMDSAGLGAMLSAYKKVIAEGGQFRICALNKDVKALFELVRMQRLFEIHEDRDSAVRSFGSS